MKLGLMTAVALCASVSVVHAEVEIKANHFKYGGVKYFRGKAENVEIGSYGEKKSPLDGANYILIQNRITVENVALAKVRVATVATIDWSRESRTDVEAHGGIKFFTASGSAAVSGSYSKAKSAKLRLVKLVFDLGPLKNTINDHAKGARNYLKAEGNGGRVVHEAWVVMEASLANHFETATSVTVSGSGSAAVTVKATAKVSNTSTKTESITISKGTTFAYAMVKVKNWNSGKTRIEKLEDDLWGLN
jgi:hypothetical protein